MGILELLGKNILIFDGAMGTMLQQRGIIAGEIPEIYNITHPEMIEDIHKMYIEAGADIITTNTFGANELKFRDTIYTVEEIIKSAVKIARKAAKDKYVALDIGPIGQLMKPHGVLGFHDAYEIFKNQIVAGAQAGADIILIETMSDLHEVKAAVLAAKENCTLPVFCTMTFQQHGRTLMGTDPITMVLVLQGLGVDALGLNCSLGPKESLAIVDEILKYSNIPVMVQPNAGLPKYDGTNTIYDINSKEYFQVMKQLVEMGVSIIGGCCGTNPEYIKQLSVGLSKHQVKQIERKHISGICSSTKTVLIDIEPVVIGERINPTGKKRFKEAVRNGDIDFIINEAIQQKKSGAHILDVNVGLPEINEKDFMINVIEELQSVIDLPLQIDSSDADVLEAATRIYNGKPIINSVNGSKKAMEELFPIVKKYGASIIGLTMDERGIPQTAFERVEIACKIIETAKTYGIEKEDIIIDCLVLTASAQQTEVMETIKAVHAIKNQLGVKTVLGVSNVSYGLPNRELLNRTYLTMALYAGLSAAIINPGDRDMMDTMKAYKVLSNIDEKAKGYIEAFHGAVHLKDTNVKKADYDLKQVIIDGLKEEAILSTKELLKSEKPMDIVNFYIVPALDLVGQKYEAKELFLPQLMQSAETVKQAFEIIKNFIADSGEATINRGEIIVATVKGDIHDIGKNIAKTLLENYGFKVIDLGKDVPIEEVVDKAKHHHIKLIGLSALMTTTVINMHETIKAIRKAGLTCTVMVGGAVLTQEYADMIGADYYVADANESVKVALKAFEE